MSKNILTYDPKEDTFYGQEHFTPQEKLNLFNVRCELYKAQQTPADKQEQAEVYIIQLKEYRHENEIIEKFSKLIESLFDLSGANSLAKFEKIGECIDHLMLMLENQDGKTKEEKIEAKAKLSFLRYFKKDKLEKSFLKFLTTNI